MPQIKQLSSDLTRDEQLDIWEFCLPVNRVVQLEAAPKGALLTTITDEAILEWEEEGHWASNHTGYMANIESRAPPVILHVSWEARDLAIRFGRYVLVKFDTRNDSKWTWYSPKRDILYFGERSCTYLMMQFMQHCQYKKCQDNRDIPSPQRVAVKVRKNGCWLIHDDETKFEETQPFHQPFSELKEVFFIAQGASIEEKFDLQDILANDSMEVSLEQFEDTLSNKGPDVSFDDFMDTEEGWKRTCWLTETKYLLWGGVNAPDVTHISIPEDNDGDDESDDDEESPTDLE